MLAKIAKAIGWKTWYHISCTYPIDRVGMGHMDLCIAVRPWINQSETITEVRRYLQDQAKEYGCTAIPTITSITRIGA